MGMEAALFLCGDVMLGRGIDQILPHPNDPVLHEPYVRDARDYVRLAVRRNGEFHRPVSWQYPWGDALPKLAEIDPVARVVNLETSITASASYDASKGIHYRMHPRNAACLSAAGIDCCVLANNHVLDWGRAGLIETLATLEDAGIPCAGAGSSAEDAWAPAQLRLPHGGRLLVFGLGFGSSGIPAGWCAGQGRPGVNRLSRPTREALSGVAREIARWRRAGDIVLASIHWGGNWGYGVAQEEIEFAHGLVDEAGVDIVHGHSSHHVKGFEQYNGRLVLYGCGDLLNDYEGISGHERYRGDLGLMYFPRIDIASGELMELTMQPVQMRRMRLCLAGATDVEWLASTLTEQGRRFAAGMSVAADGSGALRAEFGPAQKA